MKWTVKWEWLAITDESVWHFKRLFFCLSQKSTESAISYSLEVLILFNFAIFDYADGDSFEACVIDNGIHTWTYYLKTLTYMTQSQRAKPREQQQSQ